MRQAMIKKAMLNAKKFSWDRTALETSKLYGELSATSAVQI